MFLTNPITTFFNNAPVNGDPITFERTIFGWILNWIRIIGTALSIIMLTYMALRYFTSEPVRRAEARKNLPGYITGIVVFMVATNLIYYLEQIVEAIFLGI